MKRKHQIPVASEEVEDNWQIEEDARIIERYAEIMADKDRSKKALDYLESKNAKVLEAIKASNEFKEKTGFSKK